jgi:hypothetical protein
MGGLGKLSQADLMVRSSEMMDRSKLEEDAGVELRGVLYLTVSGRR